MCDFDEDFTRFLQKLRKTNLEVSNTIKEFKIVDGIWEKEIAIKNLRDQLNNDVSNKDLSEQLHQLIKSNNIEIEQIEF